MSINTHSAIAGVNVNIAGATQIGKENKLAQNCAGATGALLSGTYEQQDGCLYYCDGNHRQLLNTDTPGNAQRCGEQSPYSGNIAYTKCTLYGDIKKPYTMSFRAGESIYAYSVPSDPNCANKKRLLTCQRNGKWDNENYKYLHCTKTN
ncbi:MAG: hypothetical protein LBO09_04390 [Candidatus Peribacteria bacterium]|jgi:hypothetical protein|nr:hypothetical protein [Candidatus Peribacteria bacterium]